LKSWRTTALNVRYLADHVRFTLGGGHSAFSQTWSLTTLREKLDFVFRASRVGE